MPYIHDVWTNTRLWDILYMRVLPIDSSCRAAGPKYASWGRFGGPSGPNMLFEWDTEALLVRGWLVVRRWLVWRWWLVYRVATLSAALVT